MRRSIPLFAAFSLLALPPALAKADDTAKTEIKKETRIEKTEPAQQKTRDSERTGFTDGQNTPAGTNVVTGQEAPHQGADSGGPPAVRKAKKKAHHAKPHGLESQVGSHTDTSETK